MSRARICVDELRVEELLLGVVTAATIFLTTSFEINVRLITRVQPPIANRVMVGL